MSKISTHYRKDEPKGSSGRRGLRTVPKKAYAVSRKDSSRTSSHRRLHITPSSTASEILDALDISKSDLEAARDAIESS